MNTIDETKYKMKSEKELFEKVDKYLYDTPERTKITMAWLSANFKIKDKLIENQQKEIRALKKHIKILEKKKA